MPIQQRFNLTRISATSILLVFSIALVCLAARAPARTARTVAPQNCGSTFIGTWWPVKPEYNPGTLIIAVNPDNLSASYTLPGKPQRVLYGKISGNAFSGQWFEGPNGQSGGFIANLIPVERRVRIKLYLNNQTAIEDTEWTCEKPGPIGVGPGYPPAGGTQTVTPTPTPSPTPVPSPTTVRGDQDTDNFQTFDALTPAQQAAVITRSGPRLPLQYNASDFAMRVFVKSNWPILLEYALKSDRPAELSIEVAGVEPLNLHLEPGHHQINIMLPAQFGAGLQVGRLQIISVMRDGQPADFQLLGFAMGEGGAQALRRIAQPGEEVQLALSGTLHLDSDYEPLPLFAPMPQAGTAIQISVSLPGTIRVKQRPENRIDFSCTTRADFSDGRWEWWRVNGLDWEKVWQKNTGALSRKRTKSESWNGIITYRKLVSTGAHALQLTAWQRGGDSRDWVVARSPEKLLVVE